jgi:hypothetical protein
MMKDEIAIEKEGESRESKQEEAKREYGVPLSH